MKTWMEGIIGISLSWLVSHLDHREKHVEV